MFFNSLAFVCIFLAVLMVLFAERLFPQGLVCVMPLDF